MNLAVKTPWLKAVAVTPMPQQRLRVRFEDQRQRTLDLADLIARRNADWRLRQERYFRQVGIDPLGGISWLEGENLAPDGLERYAIESDRLQ